MNLSILQDWSGAPAEEPGKQFLSHIREVDAVVHVVRCFEDENVTHVDENDIRDIETINMELIFADLESLEGGWTEPGGLKGDKAAV